MLVNAAAIAAPAATPPMAGNTDAVTPATEGGGDLTLFSTGEGVTLLALPFGLIAETALAGGVWRLACWTVGL